MTYQFNIFNKLTYYFAVGLISTTFTNPLFGAQAPNVPVDIEIVTKHSDATLDANIKNIVKFTVQAVLNSGNPRFASQPYKPAFAKIGLVPTMQEALAASTSSLTDAQAIILGASWQLKQLGEKANPTRIDLLRTAEAASVLLSPELFDPNFKYSYDYGIYKEVIILKEIYKRSGLTAEGKTNLETYRSFGQELTCKHFIPTILVGDQAEFSIEGYLVGLSQGKALYGFSDQLNKVHGGLFGLPVELFIHDQAHWNDILMPGRLDDNEYEHLSKSIVRAAGLVLSIFNNPVLVPISDREMRLLDGFYVFHENHIYKYIKSYHKLSSAQEFFKILMVSLRSALDTGLQHVDSKHPPSTMAPTESFMYSMSEQEQSTDTFNFWERFHSDFPLLLVQKHGSRKIHEFYKYMRLQDFYTSYRDTQIDERMSKKPASDMLNLQFYKASFGNKLFGDVMTSDELRTLIGQKITTITMQELFTEAALMDIFGESVEDFVYGTDRTLDRTRIYHGPRALCLTRLLIAKFENLVSTNLRIDNEK